MKAFHIIAALFFAASVGAYAQGPAKRTIPKRVKTEVNPQGEAQKDAEAPANRPTPQKATPTPPAEAKTPPKPTPAAPVNTPTANTARPAANTARPGAQGNGRPGGGRPQAAAQTQQAKPAAGGSYRDFPTAATMPDDAAWRREIYRMLDLTKEENAVLYFPIMPTPERQNLFCFLFRQILRGNIKAYKYTPDTNEHFDDEHIIKGKALMDTHNIYYEEVTTESGKKSIRVNDADLPSEDVKLYYIKECVYYDQHSASFRTKVTALCPVLCSGYNDFGEDIESRIPLFWVKYEDAAPFFAKLSLMGSSMNNAAMISADDYFTMGRYKGDIYKTTNLQDKILIQANDAEEAVAQEQKRIEGQLDGFQRHVWGHKEHEQLVDVYGNPVLDDEGLGITYNADGLLVDSKGRRIAFVAHDKDSVNVISDAPELDPLPTIVLINERGFAVDELGNPLLREDGTPIETTDEYPDPLEATDSKKKAPTRNQSGAPTRRAAQQESTSRRTAQQGSTSRRTVASSSSAKSKPASSSKSSSKSSSSKPAKTKAPKSSAPKSSGKANGGLSVRRERH